MLESVKHVIAVASGKGGVGKSTVTANLALAMSQKGFKVGILDADIYGPSQALMLGVSDDVRPQMKDETTFLPVEAHGLHTMSMAYLVTEKTPMVWRGPMVSGAFQQILTQTDWPDLDYLFIDMPPGTGDIQLTLSQKVQVAGAVIVTTPQDIALLDAKKGVEMFRKVKIPVLGVVENMSLHTCSNCGHSEPVFGEGGGDRIAREYDTVLLGQLPLALKVREQADSGAPSVVAEPDGDIAGFFSQIADNMNEQLEGAVQVAPTISFSDD